MNVEWLRDYCLSKIGSTESFPFDDKTLVFKVGNKMFALIPLEAETPSINLKCDPERAISLREEYPAITAGYHMSKKHWNTVKLDGSLNQKMIQELIDHSYQLIFEKLSKKLQQEINS